MKKIFLCLLIISLAGCSFKSVQYNSVKRIINNLTQSKTTVVENKLWTVSIGGRKVPLLATQFDQGIRFISQQGIEVEFDYLLYSVIVVRGWQQVNHNVGIHFYESEQGSESTNFEKSHNTNNNKQYRVSCEAYKVEIKNVYSRQCVEKELQEWRYEDKVFVNDNNEIYRIEAGIFLGTEMLVLELTQ